MSTSAWDSQHLVSDLQGSQNASATNLSSHLSKAAAGISRSQDDATVGYYFQRPQSENDLQTYGGGKRWAIGDDMLVEQVNNVSTGLVCISGYRNSVATIGIPPYWQSEGLHATDLSIHTHIHTYFFIG